MIDETATELVAIEQRRCVALDAGDFDALADLVTPGYVHVHASGRVENRDTWLANLQNIRERHTERTNLTVSREGPVAIMVGEIVTTLRGAQDDKRRRLTGVAVQAWVSTAHGWRLASFQFTPTEPSRELP